MTGKVHGWRCWHPVGPVGWRVGVGMGGGAAMAEWIGHVVEPCVPGGFCWSQGSSVWLVGRWAGPRPVVATFDGAEPRGPAGGSVEVRNKGWGVW